MAAVAGAFVGAWLGFHVTPGLAGVFAPIIGATVSAAYADAASVSSMFLATTSNVRPSSSVGLNSTTSVPA